MSRPLLHPQVTQVRLINLYNVWMLLLLLAAPCFAQERSITLRGRVVDANTGEPMSNVRVVAKLTDTATITDADGAFTLELPPGPQELYITTVTYGLVKKTINLAAGTNSVVEIAFNDRRNEARLPDYAR